MPKFDYSAIRAYGEPIKGFGGTSAGHGPLKELHENLTSLCWLPRLANLSHLLTSLTSRTLSDAVSSQEMFAVPQRWLWDHFDDKEYLSMKNDKEKLMHHRWGSNNSFNAKVGMDYTWHAEQSQINGEPGYIWLDNARTRGRFKDPERDDDLKVMGFNPCVEQQLEDAELCCLTETFPAKHESYEDYLRTLKIAYLYGKTVTLSNTHWAETNAIMLKNRRIGLSQSGVVQAFNKHGRREMLEWCDKAYDYVQELDKEFSDWLCVPRSKRTTSIKPSGTVSLLNGSTPGIHYPEAEYYIRRIRFSVGNVDFESNRRSWLSRMRKMLTRRIQWLPRSQFTSHSSRKARMRPQCGSNLRSQQPISTTGPTTAFQSRSPSMVMRRKTSRRL